MEYEEETIVRGFERTRGDAGLRVGFGRAKKRFTSEELASYNLYKALKNYPQFNKEARQNYQNKYVNMPDLEYMNMDVLAAVIAFMNKNTLTKSSFQDKNIVPYFKLLYPINKKLSKEETNILNIKLKAQFLKYIRAILNFEKM